MKIVNWILLLCSFSGIAQSEISNDSTFVEYLCSKSEFVKKIIEDPEYRVQLIYTDVVQQEEKVVLRKFSRITDQYFFPASTVKLPVALVVMEKLNRLGLSLDHVLKIGNDIDCGSTRYLRKLSAKNYTFRELIEELIVVSDNDFYNALYHFVSPGELNDRLNELGFTRTNIYKSFTGCETVEHLTTNSCAVLNSTLDTIYYQSDTSMNLCDMQGCYFYSTQKKIGVKHEYERRILKGPYDFNYNLEIPLEELDEMLLRLLYPENFSETKRWNLEQEQREFLIKACSMTPRELNNVKYKDLEKYPPAIYKYSLSDMITDGYDDVKTVSKIGLSYGFTTEMAHVLNRDTHVNFQLSVSIYTNRNKTVNDGIYEYEEVARPFINEVSEILYEYEIRNTRSEEPVSRELEKIVFE